MAGEPKAVVAPCSSIARMIFSGSHCAGRVTSMSGKTLVIPKAMSKSAKSGKQARSTSPGLNP